MEWQPLHVIPAPSKRLAETPNAYIKRIELWSCKKLAEVRKELRAAEDKTALRRRWRLFVLVIEKAN